MTSRKSNFLSDRVGIQLFIVLQHKILSERMLKKSFMPSCCDWRFLFSALCLISSLNTRVMNVLKEEGIDVYWIPEIGERITKIQSIPRASCRSGVPISCNSWKQYILTIWSTSAVCLAILWMRWERTSFFCRNCNNNSRFDLFTIDNDRIIRGGFEREVIANACQHSLFVNKTFVWTGFENLINL